MTKIPKIPRYDRATFAAMVTDRIAVATVVLTILVAVYWDAIVSLLK